MLTPASPNSRWIIIRYEVKLTFRETLLEASADPNATNVFYRVVYQIPLHMNAYSKCR